MPSRIVRMWRTSSVFSSPFSSSQYLWCCPLLCLRLARSFPPAGFSFSFSSISNRPQLLIVLPVQASTHTVPPCRLSERVKRQHQPTHTCTIPSESLSLPLAARFAFHFENSCRDDSHSIGLQWAPFFLSFSKCLPFHIPCFHVLACPFFRPPF